MQLVECFCCLVGNHSQGSKQQSSLIANGQVRPHYTWAPKHPPKDNYLILGSASSITHQRTSQLLFCVSPDIWLGAEATPGKQPALIYRLQEMKNPLQFILKGILPVQVFTYLHAPFYLLRCFLLSSAIEGKNLPEVLLSPFTTEAVLRQSKSYRLQHSSIQIRCLRCRLGRLWLRLLQATLHTTLDTVLHSVSAAVF